MPNLIGATKLEDLSHQVARLDVDKNDLRRLNEFLNRKLHELLLTWRSSWNLQLVALTAPRKK